MQESSSQTPICLQKLFIGQVSKTIVSEIEAEVMGVESLNEVNIGLIDTTPMLVFCWILVGLVMSVHPLHMPLSHLSHFPTASQRKIIITTGNDG